ncbi:uncharacterized protein LOC131942319 [Physella acuta]|uniref:uncharacterized protein LOC131942319 n=1 Tax=Physella acuta TaxID=109671 RepID=UPI0027DD5A13|nr:uncharacterized protein LOC131942319 [Physella acuta]
MLRVSALYAVLSTCILLTLADRDYQSWSENTHLDKPFSLLCNDTDVQIESGDQILWTRLNHDRPVANDTQFELQTTFGIENMTLFFKKVTGSLAGIYFCNIYNASGFVSRIVRGINVGGPLYDDYIDKYRWNIVVGVVAAACVMFIIIGIGVVDNFRYQSPEQKEKRRARRNHAKQLHQQHNGDGGKPDTTDHEMTYDTADHEMTNNHDKTGDNLGYEPEGNTHL